MSWLSDRLRRREPEPDELHAVWAQLGDDERRVLLLIAQRLLLGQAQYGRLCIETDPRDWRKEAIEECADGLVYAAVALIDRRSP